MRVSDAKNRANKKYREKFEFIQTRLPADEKALICNHAEKMGESLNAFVRRAMAETMDRDNLEFEKDDSQ